MLHRLHIFLRGLGCLVVGVVQLVARKELGRRVAICTPATGRNLLHKFRIKLATTNGLHHGKMFEIVVRLKQGVASEELNKNASYAPDIAGEAPAELKDNLRSSVVPR